MIEGSSAEPSTGLVCTQSTHGMKLIKQTTRKPRISFAGKPTARFRPDYPTSQRQPHIAHCCRQRGRTCLQELRTQDTRDGEPSQEGERMVIRADASFAADLLPEIEGSIDGQE